VLRRALFSFLEFDGRAGGRYHFLNSVEDIETSLAHRGLVVQKVQRPEAFNRSDETAFSQCLDQNIVMFTVGGDFYGRDHVMEFYRKKYFQHDPPGHIEMSHRAHHLIGDAIWLEYDLKIIIGEQVTQARENRAVP
jgi:hypothetical protein